MPVDTDTKLELTPRALQNLANMQRRVNAIGSEFGFNSDQYRQVLESFNQALLGIIRLGGRVTAEDDLSLLVDSFITVGCIWHAKHIGNNQRHSLLGEWSLHS
jgi:hypothetical protein